MVEKVDSFNKLRIHIVIVYDLPKFSGLSSPDDARVIQPAYQSKRPERSSKGQTQHAGASGSLMIALYCQLMGKNLTKGGHRE